MEEDDELASKCRRLHFVTPVHLDLDPKFGLDFFPFIWKRDINTHTHILLFAFPMLSH